MSSMLDKIENNFELFECTENEIIKFFNFGEDFHNVCCVLFKKWNKNYEKDCERCNRDVNEPNTILVRKDKDGNCFLIVKGNDGRSDIVIDKDNADKEKYGNIKAYKITESKFAALLDVCTRERIEKMQEELNIPSRFLREEPGEVDLVDDLKIDKLIEYYKYLNDEYFEKKIDIILFDEPNNISGPKNKLGISAAPRKNAVIDYKIREEEFNKYNPVHRIKFNGINTKVEYDCFVYYKDGYVLAVVEPVSGLGYQYALNLGPIDVNDIELIKNNIKAVLEAEEDIVMFDDAIMRKNHTTIDAFSDNLRIFLDNAKSIKPFYYDTERAKDIYRK